MSKGRRVVIAKALESILASLRWLGLDWDEEPVFQSRRGNLYRAAVERLLASGAAYRCFCTPEKLEAERERARREKLEYHYTGTCRNLAREDIDRLLAEGTPCTTRFRVPDGEPAFVAIRGDMDVNETNTGWPSAE